MRFTIKGRIKPYVRMTQRSKWADPQAAEYLSIKAGIGLQVNAQMNRSGFEMLPPKTPLSVSISFHVTDGLHRCDLDNQGKAVLDALQGIVYKDDAWVDKITLERELGDEDVAVVAVWRDNDPGHAGR